MENIVKESLGNEFGYAWTGEAYQETQGGTTVTMVMLFAVIITLLVLAAQYESITDPVAVVISMPTAILGTVIGCVIMGQSISIYTQIGIILLLGLSAKNAILIVEYAIDFRKQGMPVRQAAAQGGNVRFRPIMMTAMAFVFGVMPMLFATGAGAASRVASEAPLCSEWLSTRLSAHCSYQTSGNSSNASDRNICRNSSRPATIHRPHRPTEIPTDISYTFCGRKTYN